MNTSSSQTLTSGSGGQTRSVISITQLLRVFVFVAVVVTSKRKSDVFKRRYSQVVTIVPSQMIHLLEHMYYELNLIQEFNINPAILRSWLVSDCLTGYGCGNSDCVMLMTIVTIISVAVMITVMMTVPVRMIVICVGIPFSGESKKTTETTHSTISVTAFASPK